MWAGKNVHLNNMKLDEWNEQSANLSSLLPIDLCYMTFQKTFVLNLGATVPPPRCLNLLHCLGYIVASNVRLMIQKQIYRHKNVDCASQSLTQRSLCQWRVDTVGLEAQDKQLWSDEDVRVSAGLTDTDRRGRSSHDLKLSFNGRFQRFRSFSYWLLLKPPLWTFKMFLTVVFVFLKNLIQPCVSFCLCKSMVYKTNNTIAYEPFQTVLFLILTITSAYGSKLSACNVLWFYTPLTCTSMANKC